MLAKKLLRIQALQEEVKPSLSTWYCLWFSIALQKFPPCRLFPACIYAFVVSSRTSTSHFSRCWNPLGPPDFCKIELKPTVETKTSELRHSLSFGTWTTFQGAPDLKNFTALRRTNFLSNSIKGSHPCPAIEGYEEFYGRGTDLNSRILEIRL